MGHDMTASMKKGIENSTVTMCFVDQNYQQSKGCQAELQHARNVAKKPVVVVIVEGNFWSWSTDAFKELCDVRTKMFGDLSEMACQAWDDPDEVDVLLDALAGATALLDIQKILNDLDCRPSVAHFSSIGSSVVASTPGAPSAFISLIRGGPKRSKVYIGVEEQPNEHSITIDVVKDPAKALTSVIFQEYIVLRKPTP